MYIFSSCVTHSAGALFQHYPPEEYLDAMVASIITNHSVPASLDITNLLRVEKVTREEVVTLVTGARPATVVCGILQLYLLSLT